MKSGDQKEKLSASPKDMQLPWYPFSLFWLKSSFLSCNQFDMFPTVNFCRIRLKLSHLHLISCTSCSRWNQTFSYLLLSSKFSLIFQSEYQQWLMFHMYFQSHIFLDGNLSCWFRTRCYFSLHFIFPLLELEW